MFNELDAIIHFLPKLQMAINASRNDEIRFGGNNVCNDIAMHITFLIAFGVR